MSETLVPTDCRALLRGDLPVLKSGVENLKEMGITGIRQGGSFASQPYKDSRDGHYGDQASMFWKRWTGPLDAAEYRADLGRRAALGLVGSVQKRRHTSLLI
jgi:hypothetical protein